MIESADKVLENTKAEVIAHVLTDQIKEAELFAKELQKIRVVAHEIEPYSWPEATLFRYRLMNNIADEVNSDLVMHLDADMLVIQDFLKALPNNFKNGIALVRHPGYYRPLGVKKIAFYLKNKHYIRQDLEAIRTLGGIGDWETSRDSFSFVPRAKRHKYVCGGTWFGFRVEFFNMVEELAILERMDTDNGVLPKWHDESILNSWASTHETTTLPPSFCFDPKYPQLCNLDELIRAVDKNE